MIRYHFLEPENAADFASMTFPAYRHLLSLAPSTRHENVLDQRPIQPIAIAAGRGVEQAGLVLAELPAGTDDPNPPEVLSIFVAPEFRGQGVATRLLQELQKAIAAKGFRQLTAVYMTGKPEIEFVERMLRRCGWERPDTRMICVRFDLEGLQQAPWLHKYPLEGDYEIFPWVDLTAQEREELRQSHQANSWIAEDLLPWKHEKEPVEPQTSLGLRYKRKVVGWVLNHALSEKMIRATCSYVDKRLGRLGRIVPVYAESFRRARASGFTEGMFTTPLKHKTMVKFAERRFVPWSTFYGETRGAVKNLAPTGGA